MDILSARDLTSIVNASGFMFQIAVENAIEAASNRHRFKREAREHPWRRDGESGFVDLILGRNTIRVVCECKRSRDANWIFLVEGEAVDTERARLHWVERGGDAEPLSGWHDFDLTTDSPESSFCVVRGQGENDRPLLERIAGTLVSSIEGLADEEAALLDSRYSSDKRRVYVPVIITTARLWVCRYVNERIDLTTGLVEDAKYEDVPAVRFRKALTTAAGEISHEENEMPYRRFRRLAGEQERTVFVVNSASVVDVLCGWKNNVVRTDSSTPW